jgi:hypothetical protein
MRDTGTMNASRKKALPKRKPGKPAAGRESVFMVRVPRPLIDHLDEWAGNAGMSRSEAVRYFIEDGISRATAQRASPTEILNSLPRAATISSCACKSCGYGIPVGNPAALPESFEATCPRCGKEETYARDETQTLLAAHTLDQRR